jgi:hypothetical protein
MTKIPDNKYRSESLLDWEIQTLRQKSSRTSSIIGLILIVVVGLSFLLPFFPPRYGLGNWSPPATMYDYQDRVTDFLIIAPILILVVFVFKFLRTKIDILLNFKWVGDFQINNVIELGRLNFVSKKGWPFYTIRQGEEYFNSVTPGHIITIKRTATFKLISIYIRNTDKFSNETRTEKPATNSKQA